MDGNLQSDPQRKVDLIADANQLYWGSTSGVNHIAEQLDLSKAQLYGLIQPIPSGDACPSCGGELVFSNRTARDKKAGECPTCDREEAIDSVAPPVQESDRDELWLEEEGAAPPLAPSGALLLGTALIGVATGIAIASFLRKR